MPKFLDAPSWYDDDGNLKTIQGDFRISIGGGYNVAFDVPWVDGTNTSSLPSQAYYLLPGSTTSGRIPYFSGASVGYQTLSSGAMGQVLTSNGSNAAPTWSSKRYFHCIRLVSAYMSSVYFDICFTFVSQRSDVYTAINQIASDMMSLYPAVMNSDGTSHSIPGFPAFGSYDNRGVSVTGIGAKSSSQLRIFATDFTEEVLSGTALTYLDIYDSVVGFVY